MAAISSKKKFKIKTSILIALGFLSIILIGSFFLSLPVSNRSGKWLNYIDAIFSSTSAVCVTGLITVPTAVNFTIFGQIVILLLIQVGGLGFMTITTLFLLLIRRKITLKDRLALQEALNQNESKGMVRLVLNIAALTFTIEAIGACILMPVFIVTNGPIGIFQAFFTSVSAFCNAGFDLFGTVAAPYQGLMAFQSNAIVSITICMMIILGGLGFTVIMDIMKCKFNVKKFSIHSKIVLSATGILILGGFIFFLATEFNNSNTMGDLGWWEKIIASIFQSITPRTAGFNTIDQAGMRPASKLLTMFLMFIGASPASTGGGVKTTTFTIVLFMMISGIRGKESVTLYKKNIPYKNCFKAIAVLILSFAIVIITTLLLLITEHNNVAMETAGFYNVDDFLFESFSAMGTVGLSTGLTSLLTPIGKVILMLGMFLGRIGPMTVGLLFLSNKNKELICYPDGNILIG